MKLVALVRRCAPLVEFITERRYGWTQEQLAHASTGRNVATGKLRLSVAVRNRHNGIVRFDADLFKLDYNLSQDAIRRLYCHWHDPNPDYSLPKKTLRRMDCHFSLTTIIFDATAQQVDVNVQVPAGRLRDRWLVRPKSG
jgi:hypothetical protein